MSCRSGRPSRPPLPRRSAGSLVVVLALGVAGPSAAQYTPPGTTGPTSDIPPGDTLRARYEDARWHLGALAVSPWLGLRDGSFVVDSGEGTDAEQDDFTATAGAGLRGYLRFGPKVLIAAHVLPEYVWWAEDRDKRQWNGRYGLGAFAYFNRLEVEASAKRLEDQSLFSFEVLELSSTRTDRARLAFDLNPRRKISLFGAVERSAARSEEPANGDPRFPLLDRDEDRARLVLRFRPRSWLLFGVGVERGETEFLERARNLSGSERSISGHAGYDGGRFGASISLASRSLEPDPDSELPETDETTGDLQLRLTLASRAGVLGYWRRGLVYSVRDESAYLGTERFGARLELGLAATSLAFVAETGEDDVEAVAGGSDRTDEVLSYGIELRLQFRSWTRLALGAVRSEIDSPIDAFDRDLTLVRVSLQVDLATERLRIGEMGSDW